MPDPTPVIVGILAGLATALFIMALVGRADASRPRCRACKRDARPYAWRDPRRCECGADLSASNAVRGVRARGWKAPVRAMALGVVALLVARAGIRLGETGGQWRDYLPAPLFGALLGRDFGEENIRSLGSRVWRGLGAEEAQAILNRIATGSAGKNSKNVEMLHGIVRDIVVASPPLVLDPTLTKLFLAAEVTGIAHESTAVLSFDVAGQLDGTVYLRLDAIEADGRALTLEVRDVAGSSTYASWFRLDEEVKITVLAHGLDPDAPMPKITVRGEMLWLPISQLLDDEPERRMYRVPTPSAPNAPPIALRPERSRAAPTTGTFEYTAKVVRELMPPQSSRPRSQRTVCDVRYLKGANLDHDAVRRPYFVASVVAAVATALGFLCVSFGLRAGRGWHGLEPPRCARCSMQLRGANNDVQARCSECGADTAARGATRWMGPRRSRSSIAITLPITLIGGVAAAALSGWLVAGSATTFFDEHIASRRPQTLRLLDHIEANDEYVQQAWIAIQDSSKWPIEHDIAGEFARRLLAHRDSPTCLMQESEMTQMLGRLHRWMSAMDPKPPEVDELAEAAMPGGSVSAQRRAFVGDPVALYVTTMGMFIARVEGAGSTPLWFAAGLRTLPPFTTVGHYELSIDTYENVYSPAVALGSGVKGFEEFAASAPRHRRETLTIDVVDDLARLAEPLTDPTLNPFATPGLRVGVTLADINGCRWAYLGASGPGAELLIGHFEANIDGQWCAFRQPEVDESLWMEGLLPAGEMTPTIELRFVPGPPTVSHTGARLARPRWGVEQTIELRRTSKQLARGRAYAMYGFEVPAKTRSKGV